MKLIPKILSFSCALFLLSTSSDSIAETNQNKPNFLFILTDDQAIDTIHALGNERIHTPNLDKLVESGTAFTHVFNQGSWSGAVCAPSRQMINTGRNVFRTGFNPNKNQTEHPLWGETFRKNGYETFITGKWHVGNDALKRSFDIGRNVFPGGMSHLKDGGQWRPKLVDFGDGVEWDKNTKKQHTSEAFTDAAVAYIDNKPQRNQEPFLMYVAYTAPHDPRQSPQSYVDKYPAESITLPDSYQPLYPFDTGDYNIRDEALMDFPRTKEQTKAFIGEYYAMIEHMDAQIGRILEKLEQSPYADNTYIIFTSDHGLAVGKHGLAGKQNSYDHSIRAPFIMVGKGINENVRVPGMFYLNSIFPTTAELAGIKIPKSVDAPSIVPLIEGEKLTMFDTIYGAYRQYQRMARNNRYKLIYFPMLRKNMLFDLLADPMEITDIANKPGSEKIIAELTEKLEQLKQDVGDPLDNASPEKSYAPFMTKHRPEHQYQAIKFNVN